MKVIITGATGFIGSALCKEMLMAGHSVTAVVRPGSSRITKLPQDVSVIEMELDKLSELAGDYDLFYHLAWNGSSGEERNDFHIQLSNITYTVEAVQAAKRCGCQRFIGAGSQAEYGVVPVLCSEDTTPHPFNMYGAAKLAAYHVANTVAEQANITFIWPRIYSVYGIGENSDTLLSYLINSLEAGEVPQLSNCENMWDFLYITDCTATLKLLAEHQEASGIYNLSYGDPKPLKNYVELVRDLVAPGIELRFGARSSDITRTYWLEPSINKIKELGFKPNIKFDDGISLITRSRKGGNNERSSCR